ncbi:MAG: ribulose-phosphate 3-epimerase [Acidobacteriota bacterium]
MNPVFPSILSTDFYDLHDKLGTFKKGGIDFIHLDIMDGHFVDNLSFGPSIVKPVKKEFGFEIDSHLMVSNPEKIIPYFIKAGSDWISFHIEIEHGTMENIDLIKNAGKKAGLAINPDTDISKLFPYLSKVDYVLLMSVFPGYGGQKFIEESLNRSYKLKEKIKSENPDCLIQMDGGISASNTGILRKKGVDLFVMGTSLYNTDNIEDEIKKILKTLEGEKNEKTFSN